MFLILTPSFWVSFLHHATCFFYFFLFVYCIFRVSFLLFKYIRLVFTIINVCMSCSICTHLHMRHAPVHLPNIFTCLINTVYCLMYLYTLHTLAFLYTHSYSSPSLHSSSSSSTHTHTHTHTRTHTHAHTQSTFDVVCILTRLCPLYEPGGSDTSSPLDWSSTLSKVNPGLGHFWNSGYIINIVYENVHFTLLFPGLDCCDVLQVWLGIFFTFSVVIFFLLVILSCSPPLCLSLSFFPLYVSRFLGIGWVPPIYEFFFPHGFFAPQVLWTCLWSPVWFLFSCSWRSRRGDPPRREYFQNDFCCLTITFSVIPPHYPAPSLCMGCVVNVVHRHLSPRYDLFVSYRS